MITSFEVGAVFDIENLASDKLETIAEQVQRIATDAKAAAESLQSIGDVSFTRANRGLRTMRDHLADIGTAASGMASEVDSAAAAAGAAASKAAEEIGGIGAALSRVRDQSHELRQELAIPYAMGGIGGGYSGGGGYDGGGLVPSYDSEVLNTPRRQIGYDRPIIDAESYELSRLGYGALHLPAPDPEELGSFGGGGGLPALIPGSPYYSGDSGGANFRRSGYVPNWVPGGVGTPGGGSVPPAGGGGLGPEPGAPGPQSHEGPGLMQWFIEGAFIKDAYQNALETDDAIRRAEGGLLLPDDPNSPIEQANHARLQRLVYASGGNTVYSAHQVAMALPTFAPELGFTGQEGLEKTEQLFPVALRFAEVAQREGQGRIESNLTAGTQYAHLTGRYEPADYERGLDTFNRIVVRNRETPNQLEAALSYSLPIARAAGMDPDQAAVLTGFLQSTSRNSTTAGTGLSAMLLGVLDTGGPMNAQHARRVHNAEESLSHALHLTPDEVHAARTQRHGTAHQQALRALGITDQHGHLLARDAHGNIDFDAIRHDIYNFAQHHNQAETTEELQNAFGVRGFRQASQFTTLQGNEQYERYRDTNAASQTVEQLQAQFAQTPLSQFEQGLARAGDTLNILATDTVPALGTAFHGLTELLTGVNAHLQDHPGSAMTTDTSIGVGLGAQVLHWGADFAAKRGWTGLGGRLLGRMADEVNPRTGLVPAIYELGADAIGAGVGAIEDTVFGPKPRQQAVQAEHEQHNDLAGRWLRGLFPLSLGIDDLFDHPPSAANTARSPAASAAAPAAVNSNNTTTISVGGVNVTVNAAPGQEGQAAGQSVASAIMNALRTHLMTSSGPGEGITHAAGTVGLLQ